ncbi:DUF5658 family protein [Bacillus sp. Marseille-P3661]|uniref:DUF5658 family protein n=1 Tax=Bacillus sp. Marseille-P3661 TaxID=1936234 RepID=UPI000C848D18|nr:DUF5658 family protein [Bacillus sp. Marseille-P3661]
MNLIKLQIVILSCFSLADGYLTYIGVYHNVISEANPWMGFLLTEHPMYFFLVKCFPFLLFFLHAAFRKRLYFEVLTFVNILYFEIIILHSYWITKAY